MRIFVITDPKRDANKVAEYVQILHEYDFDVENPLDIEEYEKRRVELGLYDEGYGWLKRDIQKLLRCDGALVKGTFTENEYENKLYEIAKELPWIGESNIRYLHEWIEESTEEDEDLNG